MKTVEGYNVKIYTDNIEDSAIEQIKKLLMPGLVASSVLRET